MSKKTSTTKQRKPSSPARSPGAPSGNRNAIRHGLVSGQLPKGCAYIQRQLNEFRRTLEDLVHSQREISPHDSALINTALRHERHAQLCQRWLAKSFDKLSVIERVKVSADIGKASDARDKCLAALGLDHTPDDDPLAFLNEPAGLLAAEPESQLGEGSPSSLPRADRDGSPPKTRD